MTETPIDFDRRLGDLVREVPEYAQVFETVGIDYCCNGTDTLAAACDGEGLDPSDVRDRLADARRRSDGGGADWESPSELVDHVVATHHEYLREELPALEALADTVRRAHGDAHPELAEIVDVFDELATEIESHIDEEEDDVFPAIEGLDRGERLTDAQVATLREAIDELEDDHAATADLLERLDEVSNGYAVPDDACPSYRSLFDRLEALERDTHRHVHKENNVLFPAVEAELVAGD